MAQGQTDNGDKSRPSGYGQGCIGMQHEQKNSEGLSLFQQGNLVGNSKGQAAVAKRH